MINVNQRTKALEEKLVKVVQNRAITIAKDLYDIATNKVSSGSTPVWSGRFLASWNLSVGKPDYANYNHVKPDPKNPLGAKPTPDIKFSSSTSLETIYIVDAMPYAEEIQLEGTKYSDPFILQRIVESYKWH